MQSAIDKFKNTPLAKKLKEELLSDVPKDCPRGRDGFPIDPNTNLRLGSTVQQDGKTYFVLYRKLIPQDEILEKILPKDKSDLRELMGSLGDVATEVLDQSRKTASRS